MSHPKWRFTRNDLARDTTSYKISGLPYFAQREQHVVKRRLTRRLERLGCRVVLEPLAWTLSRRHFSDLS
jgi:hypothetical protein